MGFQGLLNLSFCFLNWKWPWSLCCFRSTSIVCLEKSVFLFFFYCRLNKTHLKNPVAFCAFFNVEGVTILLHTRSRTVWRGKEGQQQVETLEAKREKRDSVNVWTRLLLSFASSGNLSSASPCVPNQTNKQPPSEDTETTFL